MLKNYLKIAFRSLWRRKGFSFINITGLAIGMASAALILLWIRNELSYDDFHRNNKDIYQAWNRGMSDGKIRCWRGTPAPLAHALQKEIPGIMRTSRAYSRWYVTAVGEKKMSSLALIAEPSFLSMFSFPFVQGDVATALDQVYSIVITEKFAKKMFGNDPAMNKTILIDGNNFKITGILKDLPPNSSFDFEYLVTWEYFKRSNGEDLSWDNNYVLTYVQLLPGGTETGVDAQIKNISQRHSLGQVKEEIFLHPLRKWHLYSNFENGKIAGGRIEMVRLFGLIALFILLIACINFMNLSTARSEQRAKEVGIRKVSGAHRGLLIAQFLGESILIALIAGILAFILVQQFLPPFDRLTGKELLLPYHNFYFWGTALLFVVSSGLIAGSYPAFFISSFQPVTVLKGAFKRSQALINPRKVLVVLQFTFAIILIICTMIVTRQIRYGQQRETGYDRGQLAYHWTTGTLEKKYPLLKNELLASGVVTEVGRTSYPVSAGGGFYTSSSLGWQGKDPNDKTNFDLLNEDEGMVRTAGLKLVQGRDIDLTRFPTDSTAMLLNESAVRAMGFKDPIGQLVLSDNKIQYHVIGVVKDFVLNSPYDATRPMVMAGPKGNYMGTINMKTTPGRNTAEGLKVMEQLFKKYNPDYPFEYHFADDDYARKFEDTQRIAALTGLFAGLTIFISCLGLFGLATYMAENRIKEIGVRKVLGASVFRITALLSKEFLALVVISILIASPIAWYAMHTWLQGYSYRIPINGGVFLIAGGLSVIISLVTVSYQTIRAALANPVKSLRSE